MSLKHGRENSVEILQKIYTEEETNKYPYKKRYLKNRIH